MAFNPLDHPIAFASPDRVVESAWLTHTPFGMCIIDMLRPRVLVELGVHRGVSYSAFCQAVRALGTATACYGIDTWEGDPQTRFYGSEVLAELRDYHDARYGDFSHLLQSSFNMNARSRSSSGGGADRTCAALDGSCSGDTR